jgi:hypothetical protein
MSRFVSPLILSLLMAGPGAANAAGTLIKEIQRPRTGDRVERTARSSFRTPSRVGAPKGSSLQALLAERQRPQAELAGLTARVEGLRHAGPAGHVQLVKATRALLAKIPDAYPFERFTAAQTVFETDGVPERERLRAQVLMTQAYIEALEQRALDLSDPDLMSAKPHGRQRDLKNLAELAHTKLSWSPSMEQNVVAAQRRALSFVERATTAGYVSDGTH